MSVLLDLAQRLDDANVATLWTDLYVGRLPDQPDEVIALQTYQGDASRLHDPNNLPVDERFNVQVLIRSSNQAAAESLAGSVFDSLQFRSKTLNSGARYAHCRAVQQPTFLMTDENDRTLVGFNVEVRRHRDTLP